MSDPSSTPFLLEQHFAHWQIAQALGFRPVRCVVDDIKRGLFGRRWLRLGKDYLVPAADVAAFFANHRPASSPANGVVDLRAIHGRSEADARRVAGLRRGRQAA